jgi:riboflavin kinase/FMN adenylyltransferase
MDRLHNDSGGLIDITKVAKVGYHGEKISSTSIRERLLTGNVEEIPHLLGSLYKIKCDWDGRSLTSHPYYTLPAPGQYAITLENAKCSIQTDVKVIDTFSGLSLKLTKEIPPLNKGEVSIVWHHRIVENNVNTYNNKALIS